MAKDLPATIDLEDLGETDTLAFFSKEISKADEENIKTAFKNCKHLAFLKDSNRKNLTEQEFEYFETLMWLNPGDIIFITDKKEFVFYTGK